MGNIQSTRFWSHKNPDFTIEKRMKSKTLTVWAGIWSGGLIGPFFFEGTGTGFRYLQMLQEQIYPALLEIPELQDMIFMQDGAPPHWLRTVRDWLDEHFPERWLGRDGPILWPPRSPDLTPMDFSVWGIIKDRCYATRPKDHDELRQVIIQEFQKFQIDYCRKTCQSVVERLEKCRLLGGAQVERIIAA